MGEIFKRRIWCAWFIIQIKEIKTQSQNPVAFLNQRGHVCGDDVDLIDGRPVGSIRVSFGYYSKVEDADAVLELIEEHFVDASVEHAEGQPRAAVNLEQIVLYPIKSCGAMRVSSWKLSSAGLEMDRQFLVMRGRKVVTQKLLR